MKEREFGIGELFFSTTDAKGIIRSGNRVFQRVAAYDEAEMIGKPHSLIRHPDMPRCVFKLLWDTIAEGQAIAAYVQNRAKTGEPYWVMATVLPCEGGYMSVRLKPSTPYFDVVREAYRDLRKLELELGGEREIDRKRAMAAAAQRLGEVLADASFADYTAFMHVALAAEIASRAAEMTSAPPPSAASASPLEAIGVSCRAIGEFLDSVFGARLDGYGALSSELATKSAFLRDLAENIRLFSLNALLASTRLGDEGAALSAVSQIIRGRSDRIGEVVGGLSRDVDGAAQCLGHVAFRLSVAKLQAQMSAIFVTELLDDRRDDRREGHELRLRQEDLGLLSSCLMDALGLLFDALADLDRRLEAIAPAAGLLRRDLDVMNVLEVNGRIEAAHVREATGIVQLFGEIREQTETARSELSHLATAAQTAGAATSATAATAVHEELDRIHDNALQLAA